MIAFRVVKRQGDICMLLLFDIRKNDFSRGKNIETKEALRIRLRKDANLCKTQKEGLRYVKVTAQEKIV